MNLLSEIISKPVLNLYTGKIEGTVKNACFDENFRKIRFLKMFDTEEEEEYLVDVKKIYALGDNLVLIKNSEALTLTVTLAKLLQENNPINLNIYSLGGTFVGKLSDVEFDEKFEVKNFLSQNAKIEQNKIVNVGENIIINDGTKKVSVTDFRPRIRIDRVKNTDNIISILPKIEEPLTDEIKETKEREEKDKKNFLVNSNPVPSKITGDGNFLIGRKALKTIYGLNNEIIIRKDNIISSKSLENAKRHSKLVELAVYSQMKA